METSLNNGMCRCCASEGTFKNFSNTYHWMGQEEVYADMLKECFDISLTTSEPGEEGGICEVCITQLRNAANFKKQVQHTEEQFKRRLENKLFKSDVVKIEAAPLDEVNNSDNDNNLSDNFSELEFELPIKKETEEPKPKKRAAKPTTSRAKKPKLDDGEPSTKRSPPSCNTKRELPGSVAIRIKGKFDMNNLVLNKNRKAVNLTNKNAVTMKREELDKHIFNLSEILKCSNATPIRNHDGIGYGCSYCNEIFIKPEQLKTHTINDHADVATTSFMKRKCLSEFFVKLDITNLHCKMCGKPASSYEDLMDHLHSEHGKGVHFDIKNQILPFKFENETLRCYICLNNFAKFKALLEHMNSHYRNFVCPICDTGFVNERRLQIHKQIHKSGVFSCGVCTKTYDTLQKRKAHEKCHVQPSGRNKCGICNEAFLCYRRKQRHLLEVHGIKPVELKCQACDKVFSDRRAFTVHTKRDHLMERRHHCTECDMKFFKSSELTHHMLKHTGERHFQCDLCLKSYGRKTTLAEHMRIHNNDRRFKCEYCGQAFVQKCSWKGHMKSKHSLLV